VAYYRSRPPKTTQRINNIPSRVEHYLSYVGEGVSTLWLLKPNKLTGRWRLVYFDDNIGWHFQVQRRRMCPFFKTWVDENDIVYEAPEIIYTNTCSR
jgi:hypothetical protein